MSERFTYTIVVEVPDEVDDGESALDRANTVIVDRIYTEDVEHITHRIWCAEWDGAAGRMG